MPKKPTNKEMAEIIADCMIHLAKLEPRAKPCFVETMRKRTKANLTTPYHDALVVLAFAQQKEGEHKLPDTVQ